MKNTLFALFVSTVILTMQTRSLIACDEWTEPFPNDGLQTFLKYVISEENNFYFFMALSVFEDSGTYSFSDFSISYSSDKNFSQTPLLVKYDEDRNYQWHILFDDPGISRNFDIAQNPEGNMVILLNYEQSEGEPLLLQGIEVEADHAIGVLAVEVTPDGDIADVHVIGGTDGNSLVSTGMLRFENESVYLTAWVSEEFEIDGTVFQVNNGIKTVLLKLDADYNLEMNLTAWAEESIGFLDYTFDENENIYMLVRYTGPGYFMDIELPQHSEVIGQFFGSNMLLAKVSPDGEMSWAFHRGSELGLRPESMLLQNDHIYVSGDSPTEIDFGNEVETTDKAGRSDAFLVKFDTEGTPVWVKDFPNEEDTRIDKIVALPEDRKLLIGRFNGEIELGGQVFTYVEREEQYYMNGFMLIMESDGSITNAHHLKSEQDVLFSSSLIKNESGLITFISGGPGEEEVEADFLDFDLSIPPSKPLHSSIMLQICFESLKTSISQSTYTEGFAVYPNPTRKMLTIELEAADFSPEHMLTIYGTDGRIKRSEELGAIPHITDGNKYYLDIAEIGLSTGLYILSVETDTSSIRQKVLIE